MTSWEARHYDHGVLYMELQSGHDTLRWCFYSTRGGVYVGQVGYPYVGHETPYLTVPVSRESFERRYADAKG